MSKSKIYQSDIAAAMHEFASDLYNAGLLDERKMNEFDDLCLAEMNPLSPQEIRDIREKEKMSQAVFARHLNVTPKLVSQWESGEKRPSDASLKLLTLTQKKGIGAIA